MGGLVFHLNRRLKVYLGAAGAWLLVDCFGYAVFTVLGVGFRAIGLPPPPALPFLAICQPVLFLHYRKLIRETLGEEEPPASYSYEWPATLRGTR